MSEESVLARGHIRKRGNGYAVVVELPKDPVTGKRRQKWLTARTKREAERLLATTQNEIDRGTYIEPSDMNVADYVTFWLEAINDTVRPSSHRRFSDVMRIHVIPALGSIPLDKLAPMHVQRLYLDRQASGLSPSTVVLIHNVLHRALAQAVKWQMLPRNVCDVVDPPRETPPEMKTWSAEGARRFLAGTADDELAALWALAILTGMRRGELLALRWADIDFERATLSVRRTLTPGGDGITFGEPKSKAGRRSIALPASAIQALKKHRARQAELRLQLGPSWQDNDLVFERGNGEFLHPNVVSRRFRSLADQLGLPRIRFHDLRHTAATLMLANGEHPKIVQERLGHSDISMTLNRYSHVTMDMQREAADRLADLLVPGSDSREAM